jgi:hypothetical protein
VDDTPHHLAGDAAKPPLRLAPVDGIDWSQYCVVRISEYVEMREKIERLRPRRLDLRRVSEWPEGQTEQNYDIVSQLRHPWEYDNLNFEVLCDYAADEIERLRAEIIATRAERDAAQTQADHLAKRLVQEARRG